MDKIPPTLNIAIWSLRSVPITLALLTLSFTGETTINLSNNPQFWWKLLAGMGIMAALTYLNHMKRLSWPISQVIYIYVFVVLILHDPYKVLSSSLQGHFAQARWGDMLRVLWVIASIVSSGLLIEALVKELALLKRWALRVAVVLSLLYIASIMFFLPGALSLWCLNNWETLDAFKLRNRRSD